MLNDPKLLSLPNRFFRDKDPDYYGRFRLWFDQVSPWPREYQVLVPIREAKLRDVQAGMSLLDPHQTWPMHVVNQGEDGAGWGFELGPPQAWYVCFEMLSDVCYIDMRNLYGALEMIVDGLEDAHFFAFSSGDKPDPWIDECRILGGELTIERWQWEPSMLQARIGFYDVLLERRNHRPALGRFVASCHREHAERLLRRRNVDTAAATSGACRGDRCAIAWVLSSAAPRSAKEQDDRPPQGDRLHRSTLQ